MNFSQFNFQDSQCLWALALIPLVFAAWATKSSILRTGSRLERFADKHLLPFLVKDDGTRTSIYSKSLFTWSLLWALGVLAFAGPRWDFKEVPNFKPRKNLVLLVDLSRGMDATDVRPSRLARAREKIADILNENRGVNIGLIGFAEDAHLITPITEDKNAIRYVLNSVRTDLISVQGDRLAPALAMANQLLNSAPGKDKAVLIMSDGEFEDAPVSATSASQFDPQLRTQLAQMRKDGIQISTMGFGTSTGAPLPIASGGINAVRGHSVLSNINDSSLRLISAAGGGRALDLNEAVTNYSLFSSPLSYRPETSAGTSTKDWEPRFYIFLIPLLLIMLPLFRRRSVERKNDQRKQRAFVSGAFCLLVGLTIGPSRPASAATNMDQTPTSDSSSVSPSRIKASQNLAHFFKNRDSLAKEALEAQDYAAAVKNFRDPYRRGVAQYRAGDYANAERSFRDSRRPSVAIASKYNLGNSLAEQQKYEEAIQAYMDVLKRQPNHAGAKKNLKIVQDLLKKKSEEQKQAQNQKQNQGQGQKQGQDQKQAQNQKQDQGQKQAQNQKQDQGQGQGQGQKQGQDQKQAQNQKQDQGQSQKQAQNQKPAQEEQLPPGDVKAENFGLDEHDQQKRAKKTEQDVDADQWLNRISNDPHAFLKNQFLIESARRQTQNGESKW